MVNMSRRGVIASTAGLPLLSALEAAAEPSSASVDVVICGAGLSGMTAALRLHQKGMSVLVLEASDRVGGRTVTEHVNGVAFDLGGQFVGPTQTHVLALAKELGVATFRAFSKGDSLFEYAGKVVRFPNGETRLAPDELAELERVTAQLDAFANATPLEAPQTAPDASRLDAMTVRAWLKENVKTAAANAVLEFTVTGLFGCTADEISMLYLAYYIRHGDSVEMLITTRDGAQDSRFVGGTQQFSQKIASLIGAKSVRLSAPVHRVVQNGDGVVAELAGGLVKARHAIVAMPPAACDKIAFDPPLPVNRRELQARMPMGRYIKVIVGYDDAFWHKKSLNAEVFSGSNYMFGLFDESEVDKGSAAIVGFVAADKVVALRALSAAERRSILLKEIASYFGDEALRPKFFLERDWTEPNFSCGGPVACPPPGTLSRLGAALREPVGRIHWAGTEAAPKWTGYMDGAVRAGEAAATAILARASAK